MSLDHLGEADVSVIGLGKLGACMAAVFVQHGVRVIGVDKQSSTVEAIQAGRSPVREPSVEAMIFGNMERLQATSSIQDAVAASRASFVIVPTPSGPDGTFVLDAILAACEEIGSALARKDDYHLVVITSTVMPGHSEGPILECLETKSGKKVNESFGLCYSPEFVALGTVIRDMLDPDFVLIGESDRAAGRALQGIYEQLYQGQVRYARMNLINAELAKLALNTYVTTKISYANMLSRICDSLPGADSDIVAAAVGLDRRIGSACLKGGMPFGGPCFPRDNHALASLAEQRGVNALLARATDAENKAQTQHLVELVRRSARTDGARIGILGLSYKPGTNVIEGSPSLSLVEALLDEGRSLIVHDPEALAASRAVLGEREGLIYEDQLLRVLELADVLVVATPWEEYTEIEVEDLQRESGDRVLIDPWRVLWGAREAEGIIYETLGRGLGKAPNDAKPASC